MSEAETPRIFQKSHTRSPLAEFDSLYEKRLRMLRNSAEEDRLKNLQEAYRIARKHLAAAVGDQN